ncbi:MAG: xanthine dehydrogenase family protein molybdopterin-binding subunit [Rubritepida sp.]|nr:xanthine dehydrogenase family protein molybdopterin-binding subunit [Rubritepida sp.]
MLQKTPYVGSPVSRVDGPLKVTGAAFYSGDFKAKDLAHGYVVSSAIAKGRIAAIDAEEALAVPGVVQVFTHLNRPRTAWFSSNYTDESAPPGKPLRPLYDDRVHYSGEPVALVIAEDFETARHAASLVRVDYVPEAHSTDLEEERGAAYEPPKERSSAKKPNDRGDAKAAFAAAPVRIDQEYRVAAEHHNPMEPHATTVVWVGDGGITVHDKTQGVQNTQTYIHNVFSLANSKVHVVSPFVGGAFGSGLRPQYQLFLAVMAALELERSVQVVLTRDQMFTHVYRPETINSIALGANADGALQSVRHEAIAVTSHHEDHQEAVVKWSGMLYHCDNVTLTYKLAKVDTHSPGDMRAPGAAIGVYALEAAMDELACALKMDPVALRLKNYAERDEGEDKPFTSKALRSAYQLGAERFGWADRSPEPRSMREGRELIGWGMAGGVWEAKFQKSSARAVMTADGSLEVAAATSDIGTGTYTILTQIAADTLGVPLEDVTTKIGDSSLPTAPLEGGSWTAASVGTAVQLACRTLREKLFQLARGAEGSPLANMDLEQVHFAEGAIVVTSDPTRRMTLIEAMRIGGKDRIEAEETASPDKVTQAGYSSNTHSAIFVEVRVDEELGAIRVTRVVNAVAAGRILNPKTGRSQIVGGVVFAIGMALEEESLTDHALGRFMNHNFAEYHVPVNADVPEIDVIFVDEPDELTSPIGVKGLGEIGIVGTSAAIANAVYHATGRRIRDLPITIDKVLLRK